MQTIIYGVLCLRLWQAGAGATGAWGGDQGAGRGADYIGVLVDTAPVRRQAQAEAGVRPPAPMPLFAPPPPFMQSAPRYQPAARPPHPIPQPYAPMSSPIAQPLPSDMFKLVAYLTKDGKIVNGRLTSVHDTAAPVDGHPYIRPRPGGVALNRPGALPPCPRVAPRPDGATLYRPYQQPVSIPHNPYSRPAVSLPPGFGGHLPYQPYQQPPQALPPPRYPQQAHLNQPELDAVVDNIVASSVGPNGERLSPQLVGDVINLLNTEMLGEIATTLLKDHSHGSYVLSDSPQANNGDPVNNQALAQLQQTINEQIRQNIGPILQQVPMPS